LQFLGLEGEEAVTLLAHFLGVSAPPEFLARLSGPQLKDRTLQLMRDVLLRTEADGRREISGIRTSDARCALVLGRPELEAQAGR
jgi:hypothetical protein